MDDINTQSNVAGAGINMAQRVMDCGDAGHILVSKAVAEMLSEVSTWDGYLHDLGEAEVKHGVRVHIYNVYANGVGNPALPDKLRKLPATTPAAPNVNADAFIHTTQEPHAEPTLQHQQPALHQ